MFIKTHKFSLTMFTFAILIISLFLTKNPRYISNLPWIWIGLVFVNWLIFVIDIFHKNSSITKKFYLIIFTGLLTFLVNLIISGFLVKLIIQYAPTIENSALVKQQIQPIINQFSTPQIYWSSFFSPFGKIDIFQKLVTSSNHQYWMCVLMLLANFIAPIFSLLVSYNLARKDNRRY